MSSTKRFAAGAPKALPQSAKLDAEQLLAARHEAALAASDLASACRDAEASPQRLMASVDRVMVAAGLLRGLAALAREPG